MSSSSKVIKARNVRIAATAWQGEEAQTKPPAALDDPAHALQAAQLSQAALAAAAAQSQQIVDAAQAQAAEVVRVAQAQAAEIARQAREEGLQAAEAEASRILMTARGVLDEVQTWRSRMLADSEGPVLQLIETLAHLIFSEDLNLSASVVQEAFARALAEARPLGDLRIHVHPDDASLLGPHWPEQQGAQSGQKLELVPNPDIRRGGCLVEGEHGSVDARVQTQLQVVLDALHSIDQEGSG
jgi:flagellar assembly protein FliH